jgi:hypothetical protein
MRLSDPQRRTLEQLIGTDSRPTFPSDLAQHLRDRIEDEVRELEIDVPLWLGKERLKDHVRCEGLFEAGISGLIPPFEHSEKSAAGVLMHKAIEVEVGAREPADAHAVAERAAQKACDEERFFEFWRAAPQQEQDDMLMEAVRRLELFRASFPPLRELRRELTPVSELRLRSELLGGQLTLSGQIDLVLGAPDRLEPTRATRLVVDLKTGGAWPEYPEDMRFYALLMTLRFGVPPYRAASLFLESGKWQAEEITEQILEHAADRVVTAARTATALQNGRDPDLHPGPWCTWCPQAQACPVAELPAAVAVPAG